LGGVDTLAELARVKAVVPQSVFRDGKSVLNADNQWTAEMARSARGEIIFFSLDEENSVIREHLRNRGRAVVLRQTRAGEMITIIEHRRETSLLLASEIPATFEGKLRVNVANAMAAAAAALADDVQLEHIRQALRTFSTSFYQTPGRFNVMDFHGRRVIMDYCHNVAGLESMADFVGRLDNPRKLAVISMPGDRLDEDIKAFGRLAGQTFDELVVREDSNRRGRANGEIAEMLKAAAIEAGMADASVHVVLDEFEAVRAGVERTNKDELVVLMIDKPAKVWDELETIAGRRPV
jgi:cyanophycin synthetase